MNLKGFLLILLRKLDSLLSFVSVCLIRLYKAVLSPLIGNNCRFHPTCSEYGIQAIKKYGFFMGTPVVFSRLLRCSPLNEGGYDPLK